MAVGKAVGVARAAAVGVAVGALLPHATRSRATAPAVSASVPICLRVISSSSLLRVLFAPAGLYHAERIIDAIAARSSYRSAAIIRRLTPAG